MALTRPALAAIALLLIGAAPASAAPQRSAQIVTYRSDVPNPPAQTRKRERDLSFTATQRYAHALHGFAARLTPGQVRALERDPDVLAVIPDRPVHADSVGLAAGETLPVGLTRVGAAAGGNVRNASGAAVAVLDSGIDLGNADLNVQ